MICALVIDENENNSTSRVTDRERQRDMWEGANKAVPLYQNGGGER